MLYVSHFSNGRHTTKGCIPSLFSTLARILARLAVKMLSPSLKYFIFSLCGAALAAPAPSSPDTTLIAARAGLTPYQPITTSCPNTQLVRPATGQGSQEAAYISSRKSKADAALATWLSKQGSFSNDSQPTVALTSSGGGYRALLEAAGVHQAFDERDSNSSVSGIYQALTYESGLSGQRYIRLPAWC